MSGLYEACCLSFVGSGGRFAESVVLFHLQFKGEVLVCSHQVLHQFAKVCQVPVLQQSQFQFGVTANPCLAHSAAVWQFGHIVDRLALVGRGVGGLCLLLLVVGDDDPNAVGIAFHPARDDVGGVKPL